MRMETKFLRLRTPVELGSLFDDWRVCWLGGWSKHRLYYLVMLVRDRGLRTPRRKKNAAAARDSAALEQVKIIWRTGDKSGLHRRF
jgi:hypothetical protein